MGSAVLLALPSRADTVAADLESALRDAGLTATTVEVDPAAGDAAATVTKGIDALVADGSWPVAVFTGGPACGVTVRAAASSPDVRALGLLSPAIDAQTLGILAEWREIPLAVVADTRDRDALGCSVDAYLGSSHPDSALEVDEAIGDDDGLGERLARWAAAVLATVGRAEEVEFDTVDGWRIHADLVVGGSGDAPGVVLLHSGRSDRTIFTRLTRLLARAGFVVLAVDWRGRGRSVNRGTYFELSSEEKAAAGNDAAAALDFLAARPEVDERRLALVGVVHGAEYAVRGAVGDDRVRALALLTGYRPADDSERDFLLSGDVEAFYVTCEAHGPVTTTMRELYEASPGRRTRLTVYPGGAIGYQLFEIDPSLEPTVVAWLSEVTAP